MGPSERVAETGQERGKDSGGSHWQSGAHCGFYGTDRTAESRYKVPPGTGQRQQSSLGGWLTLKLGQGQGQSCGGKGIHISILSLINSVVLEESVYHSKPVVPFVKCCCYWAFSPRDGWEDQMPS